MDERTRLFVERAVTIHGNKYDYSRAIYTGMRDYMTIICPVHGEFKQTGTNHIYHKHGCQKCGCKEQGKKLSKGLEHFLERAKQMHGDKYTYEKVIYKGVRKNVTVTCLIHGDFDILPSNLYKGSGCKYCTNQYTTESFIMAAQKIHGDIYDYSRVKYINSYTEVIIICKIHGEFSKDPSLHLRGQGCKFCSYKYTTASFIEAAIKIHGDKYQYSKVIYNRLQDKVIIVCSKHGDFAQKAADHLQGHGCPLCRSSRGEAKIIQWLLSKNIHFIPQFKINKSIWDPDNPYLHGYEGCFEICNLRFDFYLPDYDILIEYDGEQHEKPIMHFGGMDKFVKGQYNDNVKDEFCNNNITFLRIPYHNFKQIEKILEQCIYSSINTKFNDSSSS